MASTLLTNWHQGGVKRDNTEVSQTVRLRQVDVRGVKQNNYKGSADLAPELGWLFFSYIFGMLLKDNLNCRERERQHAWISPHLVGFLKNFGWDEDGVLNA